MHFDTSSESLVKEITTAIRVFAYGVEDFVNDPANINESLTTQLSCEGDGESRWTTGDKFYKSVNNLLNDTFFLKLQNSHKYIIF